MRYGQFKCSRRSVPSGARLDRTQQIANGLAVGDFRPADLGKSQRGVEGVRRGIGRIAVDLAPDDRVAGFAGTVEQIVIKPARVAAATGAGATATRSTYTKRWYWRRNHR